MPRLINKTVVLAKVETTQGTDAVPTGANNAIEVSNLSITPVDANLININTVKPWLGGSQSLLGTSAVKCSFEVLMAGSGVAGTAPAWGQLLLGCAMAETTNLIAPARVDYSPITDLLKTLSIYYYDDGLLHKMLGTMGNWSISLKSGDVPKIKFDFTGIDGIPVAAANPGAVLTNWKQPPAITKANVTDINLGCTYAAGALNGGTLFSSTGLTLDAGNAVAFNPLLGAETVVLTDRDVKGTMELDLTAAQEATYIANAKANTLTSLGFIFGLTAGNKMLIYAPAVQLQSPKKVDFNGQRLVGFDLRLNPLAGNDELRIVCL